MKRVVSESQVAHLWAHQAQDSARKQTGNFYFEGTTIYSYGSHFPIAKHVENKAGQKAVLFTTRTYSVTTSGHIRTAEAASSHLNVIYCFWPEASHVENIYKYVERIKELHTELLNPRNRNRAGRISEIEHQQDRLRKYTDFFGLKLKGLQAKALEPFDGAIFGQALEKEIKAQERRQKAAQRKQAKIEAGQLAKWRTFETRNFSPRQINGHSFLRVNEETSRIETSQGIEIPLEAARRLFVWILKTIKKGGCAGECKKSILTYEIDQVSAEGIKVGCHTISIQEINSIAVSQGWTK